MECGPRVEVDVVFAILTEFQAPHALQPDDGRAVNSTKQSRIQLLLEVGHAAAQEMAFRPHVQAGIVVGSFNPVDLGGLQEQDLTSALDRETLRPSPAR